MRHIAPSYAVHMKLHRLSQFDIQYVSTTNRTVHLFAATPTKEAAAAAAGGKVPRDGALRNGSSDRIFPPCSPARAGRKWDGKRFFARVLVRTVSTEPSPLLLSAFAYLFSSCRARSVYQSRPAPPFPPFSRQLDSPVLYASALSLSSPSLGGVALPELALPSSPVPGGKRISSYSELDLDAHPETEIAFVEALNALEVALAGQYKAWRNNSIFLNVLVEAAMDLKYVDVVIRVLAK